VILFGNPSYRGTGRGFVIQHDSMVNVFVSFFYSHFAVGFELMSVLLVPVIFRCVDLPGLIEMMTIMFIWLLIM
jgi:hypothetical protein